MFSGGFQRDDGLIASTTFEKIPRAMTIHGRKVSGRKVPLSDGVLDLAAVIGPMDQTVAYLFLPFTTAHNMQLTLGVGADWWVDLYVDGQPLFSTGESGNGRIPPDWFDHVVHFGLNKGRHVLGICYVRGSQSAVLRLAGPNDMRRLLTLPASAMR